MNVNLEKLNEELENYKPDESEVQKEERKQLFMSIVSEWECEADIDYSISLATLTCILGESAGYIEGLREKRVCLNRISERTDCAPHWKNAQRIL